MAFDENLAKRVRLLVANRKGVSEKQMFGGLAFLLDGSMSCGIHRDELIVRIDPAAADSALSQPGVRVFDITGRPMKGWLLVNSSAIRDEMALAKWVRQSVDYAATLPKKSAKQQIRRK